MKPLSFDEQALNELDAIRATSSGLQKEVRELTQLVHALRDRRQALADALMELIRASEPEVRDTSVQQRIEVLALLAADSIFFRRELDRLTLIAGAEPDLKELDSRATELRNEVAERQAQVVRRLNELRRRRMSPREP